MWTKPPLFLSVIFLFISSFATSQNCDTLILKKLTNESSAQLLKDVNISLKIAHESYAKSKECINTKYYFESAICLSRAYFQKNQGDSIIKLLLPILKNLPSNTNIYYKAKLNHQIGSAYTMLMDLESGLKYTLVALSNFEIIKDSSNSANSLVNIANIFQQQNNFKQADKYFRDAFKIASKLRRKVALGNVYNSMGILYAEHNKLDSSEKFFLLSTQIREGLNDKTTLAWNYNNLGGLYVMLKKPKEAIYYLEKALKTFQENGNYDGQTSVANNLGELSMKIGDSKKALEYYSYSRKLYDQTNNPDNLENLYNNLSVYYDKIGDLKTAFKYSDSLIVLKDSLYGNRLDRAVAEMQVKFEVDKKDLQILAQEKEKEIEKTKRNFIIGVLVFFVILFSIATWAFIQKRKNSKLLQLKNGQLESANLEISHQKEELTEKQKEIVDSINYAQKIQNALLASKIELNANLKDHFILLKPKDIVSGDFTWATKKDNLFYLACCDSTGHGVPGAFMSLLNIGFLSEAIKERNIIEPGKIFDYVRGRLIETIGNDDQKDGFDGVLICLDINSKTITYAAANNSPLLISNKEAIYLKCDKMPVGDGIRTESFTNFKLEYQTNDSLYLFTDGYPDQFGGPKGKKFKYKPLETLLQQNASLRLEEQKQMLNSTFEAWKGNLEQVDDVCIIGITL